MSLEIRDNFYESLQSALFAIKIGQTDINTASELIAEDFNLDPLSVKHIILDYQMAEIQNQIARLEKDK